MCRVHLHKETTEFTSSCRSLRRGAEAVPREAAAAVAARQAAVDLCQRCAGDTASDLKAEDLWFPLLQVPETLCSPCPCGFCSYRTPPKQQDDANCVEHVHSLEQHAR